MYNWITLFSEKAQHSKSTRFQFLKILYFRSQRLWPSYFCICVALKCRFICHIVEKAMATHSSILAWKIPWTEEPGRLQFTGSLGVRHDWATSLSLFTFIGEGNGNPLQYSCLENPRDGGAWWAAVSGVAQSWTRLKRLSSSSSSWLQPARLLCPWNFS